MFVLRCETSLDQLGGRNPSAVGPKKSFHLRIWLIGQIKISLCWLPTQLQTCNKWPMKKKLGSWEQEVACRNADFNASET